MFHDIHDIPVFFSDSNGMVAYCPTNIKWTERFSSSLSTMLPCAALIIPSNFAIDEFPGDWLLYPKAGKTKGGLTVRYALYKPGKRTRITNSTNSEDEAIVSLSISLAGKINGITAA